MPDSGNSKGVPELDFDGNGDARLCRCTASMFSRLNTLQVPHKSLIEFWFAVK